MASPEELYRVINHPPHYVSHSGLEAIEVIEAFAPDNFHRGCALRYLLRAGKKGDLVEDLRKAIWYIEREINNRPIKLPPLPPWTIPLPKIDELQIGDDVWCNGDMDDEP